MKTAKFWPWLLAAIALTHAQPAAANGRFPRAERLIEHVDDSQRLLLAATYGILSSTDGGESWQHICELSFGIVPLPADPLLEVSSNGILGGLLEGVTLSEDGGCDFERVFGGVRGQSTPDISVDKADRSRVLGLLKHMSGDTVSSELHQSLDGGRSFERLGEPLLAGFDFPFTVDSAPSDPNTVYVSGVAGSNVGQVLRSTDGGISWDPPYSLSGTSFINAPFIAAVDPNRADLLFVRTNGRELAEEQVWASDSLFVGDLTGAEGCALTPGFCELFTVRAKLFGFALSPDGEYVLLGLGDPLDPAFRVDPRFVGLYSGATADLLAAPVNGTFPPPGFKRVHSGPVSCVTWTPTGIYVCTSQEQNGFALGFASDVASLERGDLTPLLDLAAVTGPLACPEGTSTSMCGREWEETCEDLGACGNEAGSGGAAGAETSGQAGAPQPSGGAATSPTGGAATSPTGGQPSSSGASAAAGTSSASQPPRNTPNDSGCGCRLATGAAVPSVPLTALLVVPLLLVARRRRRAYEAREGARAPLAGVWEAAPSLAAEADATSAAPQ